MKVELAPESKDSQPDEPSKTDLTLPKFMVIILDWTKYFLDYLLREALPRDQTKARCLARCVKAYTIIT